MLGSARWVSHIVQTVKKSDKMVAAVARIAFGAGDLKRDLVEQSISAGNMASVFNGTTVIIETEEARFRERPRHQHWKHHGRTPRRQLRRPQSALPEHPLARGPRNSRDCFGNWVGRTAQCQPTPSPVRNAGVIFGSSLKHDEIMRKPSAGPIA